MRFRSKHLSFSRSSVEFPQLPKWRSHFVGASFGAAFFLLAGRAFWVQGINDDFYRRQGELRQVRELTVHASRGRILDRNGQALALSLPTRTLWIDTSEPSTRLSSQQASALGKLLDTPAREIERTFADRRPFAYLKRQVAVDVARRAMQLAVPGLFAQEDYRRSYPEGNSVAHVVGFAGVDGIGQEGMEKVRNGDLRGIDGTRRVVRNARGQVIETLATVPPHNGRDVTLAIDQRIQHAAFKELRAAVVKTQARSGSAIVLDAHTGEVLAMTNFPSYDPNVRGDRSGGAMRNRAVTDVFEPGSVMKPFTMALALQKHRITPATVVPTGGGRLRLDGVTIHDDKDFGTLTVPGVLQKSSNVGTTKIALLMKPAEMWANFRALGLGRDPQVGLPGASAGRVRPYQRWRRIEQATMSYGYGLSASLLQLAQAYTTLANDGQFVPASISSLQGRIVESRQIYSPRVAREVKKMMRSVVSPDGTAPQAAVPGFSVAGKTGTAYQWTAKGYDRRQYLASFIGILPAGRPRVIIAVSIDHPRRGSHFGGAVAGPPFARIAAETMYLLNVAPDKPVADKKPST